MITAKRINTFFVELDDELFDLNDFLRGYDDNTYTIDGYEVKHYSSFRSDDGDHDTYVCIITASKGDQVQWFRCDAYYSSHDGVSFECGRNVYEVVPKERVVIDYVKA